MKILYITLMITSLTHFASNAMKQALLKAPELDAKSLKELADVYEQYNGSQDPKELRIAYFGIVGGLAFKPLSQRDPEVEKNADIVLNKLIKVLPTNTNLESFLYGIQLAGAHITMNEDSSSVTTKDHPFSQFYRPVQKMRNTIFPAHDLARDTRQKAAENAARDALLLTSQIITLKEQLAQKEQELTAKEAEKQRHVEEIRVGVQAHHTLDAYTAQLAFALQQQEITLRETIYKTIAQFIDTKNKLKEALVAHEKTELSGQVEALPKLIESDILKLWYCMHYLKRIQSPDGSLSKVDEARWKTGRINYDELNIANYNDYLKNK